MISIKKLGHRFERGFVELVYLFERLQPQLYFTSQSCHFPISTFIVWLTRVFQDLQLVFQRSQLFQRRFLVLNFLVQFLILMLHQLLLGLHFMTHIQLPLQLRLSIDLHNPYLFHYLDLFLKLLLVRYQPQLILKRQRGYRLRLKYLGDFKRRGWRQYQGGKRRVFYQIHHLEFLRRRHF